MRFFSWDKKILATETTVHTVLNIFTQPKWVKVYRNVFSFYNFMVKRTEDNLNHMYRNYIKKEQSDCSSMIHFKYKLK